MSVTYTFVAMYGFHTCNELSNPLQWITFGAVYDYALWENINSAMLYTLHCVQVSNGHDRWHSFERLIPLSTIHFGRFEYMVFIYRHNIHCCLFTQLSCFFFPWSFAPVLIQCCDNRPIHFQKGLCKTPMFSHIFHLSYITDGCFLFFLLFDLV